MGSNEEADGIIVLALRQVGCALPEEVTGIAGFVTEELVRAVSHCLHVIGDESAAEYSKVPPWPSTPCIGTSNSPGRPPPDHASSEQAGPCSGAIAPRALSSCAL